MKLRNILIIIFAALRWNTLQDKKGERISFFMQHLLPAIVPKLTVSNNVYIVILMDIYHFIVNCEDISFKHYQSSRSHQKVYLDPHYLAYPRATQKVGIGTLKK